MHVTRKRDITVIGMTYVFVGERHAHVQLKLRPTGK